MTDSVWGDWASLAGCDLGPVTVLIHCSEVTARGPCRCVSVPFEDDLVMSLPAQLVKHPPAMEETPVQFRGWEDPLEKGTATHSSILAWRIPGTEDLASYSPWGRREADTTERLSL